MKLIELYEDNVRLYQLLLSFFVSSPLAVIWRQCS